MKIGDAGADHSFLLKQDSTTLVEKMTWKDVIGWIAIIAIVTIIVTNLPVF